LHRDDEEDDCPKGLIKLPRLGDIISVDQIEMVCIGSDQLPHVEVHLKGGSGLTIDRKDNDLTETLRGSGISSMRDAQAFYAAWPIASTAIGICAPRVRRSGEVNMPHVIVKL
jgi:hypothetical protein